MNNASLDGPRAKLAWAARHYDLLDTETRRWQEPPGNPTVGAEADPINDRYVVIYYEPRPLPAELALIAGDYLSNLRSALDHLVCQAVIANGGEVGKHHAFPIAVTERWWQRNVANRDPKRRGRSPLDGIKGQAFALLAKAQPFVGHERAAAEDTALATLARLNNTDKHQRLHLQTLSMGNSFEVSLDVSFKLLGGYLPLTGEPIQPNQAFGWFKIEFAEEQASIKLDFPVEIAFDGVPLSRLRAMFEEVKALIVAFENLGV